jgi:class 3 adenylate cyclase/tetratricopeptide (TPR) repeat protein
VKCPRCQAQTPDDARFCEECGARLELTCPNCGQAVGVGKKFCRACGASLTTEPAERFTSPRAYTPKHLAEKILTSRSALEGERKQVTVLFADLKGSMELLADRDPEEARKLLDPVLEKMMEAVHRYEGTVNQVMGDGIMALFGAPLAHEDHAVRACYAALDVQVAIRRYAEQLWRTSGVGGVHVRVGLNSGEVVVRAIGSDLRMDYTAVGQTTHLAARMEQLASPGSTLLTADTLRLAESYVEVKPRGPVPVKGLENPVEVYELLGAGPRRSRLHAAATRGLTKFVGRDRELEQLREALSRAAAGHGQVVAIVGEPGVGKSRLVWEVTHSHRTHGWLIVQATSVSYGKATPYLPVIDLLRGYFQIEDRDDQRKVREKVMGKLLALDRSLEPSLSAFLALLDAPVDDAQWQRLDPPQRRQRTLEAVKRLLLRESQAQPLLVVFEDLHWIDSETQALLDSLVESLPTSRALLLVNYRPEYEHRWGGKTYYTQLRLDPLPPESAEELLQALLGSDPGLQPLKRLLIEPTEGNPFFLEESVRTLVETQALVGEPGAYRLARALPSVQVPATVQAVLAARIDRLRPEEKSLLQTAAVIGKDVPFALLQAIAEVPEEELRRGLTHLQAAEFLYEASLFPELEYTFKHALTHEVAYQSLLHERRRALHARIVEAMERLYPDRLAERIEQLAHHTLHGEEWEKAVTYLRQAGLKAMMRSVYPQAVARLEQAVEALSHLPEGRERLELAIDLRLELRQALFPLGDADRVFEYLSRAESLAQTLGDRRRLGHVSAYLSATLWVLGKHHQAIEVGERAASIATETDDFGLQVLMNFYLGLVNHAQGKYRQASDMFMKNVSTLIGDLAYERFGMPSLPSVVSRHWLIWSLAELGEFSEAIRRAEEAVRIADAADQTFTRVIACLAVGGLYLYQHDLAKAIPLLERGLELCETWHIALWLPSLACRLACAYARSGRIPDANRVLAQGIPTKGTVETARVTAWLGQACLTAGRRDEAIGLAERALQLCRESQERGVEAWALRLHGEIASHQNRPDVATAETHYEAAMALASELGMRPLVAHCYLGLGKLHRRTGKRGQAQEHLATATTLYREMDMRFWLPQAEVEMKEAEGL